MESAQDTQLVRETSFSKNRWYMPRVCLHATLPNTSKLPDLICLWTNTEYWQQRSWPWWLRQFSSVVQLCLTLCDPMDCSTPGLPVHHQLPEPTQTHVHCIGDVIQPSHPLSSPSSPAFNLSQHQGLFKWVSSFHRVAKVLKLQHQHQFFQWIFWADFP